MNYLRAIVISGLMFFSLTIGTFAVENDPWNSVYNAAETDYRTGDYRSACDSFTKALDIALSEQQSNYYRITKSLTGVVLALRAQEKYSEARQAYDNVIAYYQQLADAARAEGQPEKEASYLGKIQEIRVGRASIPYEDKPPTAAQSKFPNSLPLTDASPYRIALSSSDPIKGPDRAPVEPQVTAPVQLAIPREPQVELGAAAKLQLPIPKTPDVNPIVTITGLDSTGDSSSRTAFLKTNKDVTDRPSTEISSGEASKSGVQDTPLEDDDVAENTLPAPVRFPHFFEVTASPQTPLVLPELPTGIKSGAATKEQTAIWLAKVNAAMAEAKYENYALAVTTSLEALKLAEQIGPNNEYVATSLMLYGAVLTRQGKYSDAEPLLKRAIELVEKIYGPNNKNTATALQVLGQLKFQTCDYSQSASLFQRALSIRENQIGGNSPLLLALTRSLAEAYLVQKKYAESEVLFKRSLSVAQTSIGPKSHVTAIALSGLSRLYQEQKKYKEALELAERALEIDDAVLGAENRQVAVLLNNIATLKMYMNDFKGAEPYLQRALAINPKNSESGILHNLGVVYLHESRFKESEETLQKALSLNPLPEHHPLTLQIKVSLGSVYRSQGQFDKAEILLNEVLAQKQRIQGGNSPEVTRLRNVIAELALLKQGKLAAAERLLYQGSSKKEREAIVGKIAEKNIHAATKPDTTSDMIRSATLYYAEGNYARAQQLFKQAIAVYERSDPNNPKLDVPLQGLASSYMRQDNFSEAEPLFKRALALVERSTGPNSEATAQAMEHLAWMYLRAQKSSAAKPLLRRATVIAEKDKNAKLQLSLLISQAELTRQEGKFAESEALCNRALSIIATKREYAPEFSKVYYCLYQIYFKQKKYGEAAAYLKKTMAAQEKLLGKHNRDYATMIGTYGQLLARQEKYVEAESALKESIAIREALAADDPGIAVNLIELGEIYLKRKQFSESAEVCKRALNIYEKQLPPNDQRLGLLLANLGAGYAKQGNYAAALPYCKRAINIFTQNGFIRTPIGASFVTFYAGVAAKAGLSH